MDLLKVLILQEDKPKPEPKPKPKLSAAEFKRIKTNMRKAFAKEAAGKDAETKAKLKLQLKKDLAEAKTRRA